MSKLVKKVRKFSLIAACLTLVLGVMGVCGGAVVNVSASSDPIIMQNIYKSDENTVVTAIVKVKKDQYEAEGLTFVCTNGDDSTAEGFHVSTLGGTVYFADGNYATVEYLQNEGYYSVTFVVKRNTIPERAKGYFYSGTAKADNGGYGYFLFE